MLAVGDGHEIYVEEAGSSSGFPLVFLHGGPGSGCQPAHRALFGAGGWRAILFDQRGAGRSTPKASRRANTTWHLVADMERIREAFGIERWLIVGGSWGATLALAYAERYPERTAGLLLRAVFLGTRAELDWAFVDGPKRLRPDLAADFAALLDPAERADPIPAYWRRILDPDPAVHGPAARAWHDAERILSQVAPPASRLDLASIHDPARPLPSTPFAEAHYFSHDCFLEPDQLLRNAHRLRNIPVTIIQGRYDFLCPPATSAALAAAFPEARLRIVEGAGHAMTEPGVTEAMMAALAEFAGQAAGTDRN